MGFVEYRTEGYVGIITMSREKALNALSLEVLKDLNDVIHNVDIENTRCLIITGAGDKAFVAGADIAQMDGESKESALAFSRYGSDLFLKIERFPIPVIAAVNGFALGGGFELALCCDIRIASENAAFGLPETGLGIIPGFGGTQRLPRLINPGLAKELLYTGRKVKAKQALEYGIVTAVYSQDELMDKAMELANRIAANAPIAVRAAKRAVVYGLEMTVEQGTELEYEGSRTSFGTEDQKNAMRAFVEKRKPDPFINR